jgi:hypothetical protein
VREKQNGGRDCDLIEVGGSPFDSMRLNRDFDSNETDKSGPHEEKQSEPRISISRGIVTEGELERLRINLGSTISISKSSRITNLSFPLSIEIDDTSTFSNAEPSINRTPRGIKID